jgi:hypothetical protein
MSLTFLVPLFLLGIAGIVVPVVMHLTRRQRRQVVTFPSLMFLEKIPFQEQRRRRIQHWLLLLLRALALSLLAIAFARPFMEDAELSAGGSTGPREVVVLLDRSYSMDAGDLWDQAVAAARSIFGELGPLDRASRVIFAQGAEVAARSTSDRSRLDAALADARVGSGTTRYGPAMKVAQTILEESTLHSGQVYLISDYQRIGWTGDEGIRLPAGSVVTPIPVQAAVSDNVQIGDVRLLRQATSGRERVTASARVVRRGGQETVELPVVLELDGQEIQRRTVRLQPDGAEVVSFAPFTLSLAHTRGAVRVPTDDIEADDARYFVISPGNAVSIVVAEGARAGRDASLYVQRALETSAEGRFRVRLRRGDGIRTTDLDGSDVVVLNDERVDGASAALLRDFVREGGGLLVGSRPPARLPGSGRGPSRGSGRSARIPGLRAPRLRGVRRATQRRLQRRTLLPCPEPDAGRFRLGDRPVRRRDGRARRAGAGAWSGHGLDVDA